MYVFWADLGRLLLLQKFRHQAREPNLHIPLNLSPPPLAATSDPVRLPANSSRHNPGSAEPAADLAALGTAALFPIN
jgi:hypothetical protein